jgi:hypothetical protein
VGRLDLCEREKSQLRTSDVAGKNCLVADAHRAQAELLVDEIVPRTPAFVLSAVLKWNDVMKVLLFASRPSSRRSDASSPFSGGMKTVKPERPSPSVRAHDLSEALDRARERAF